MSAALPSGANGVTLCLDELVPYRRLARQVQLTPKASSRAHQAGQHQARAKGRGMDFDEVRQYQVGDDIRTIDWRVTARTGKPHTKLFREERERPVHLIVDLGPSMQFGSKLLLKAVQAAHLASLLAWHVAERGDRIGALIGNGDSHKELKPKGRQQGVLALAHALIDLQNQAPDLHQSKPELLNDLLRRSLKLAAPGSQIWLLTDLQGWDTESQWLLARLHKHADVCVFMITDPLELTLPQSRLPLTLPVQGPTQKGLLPIGSARFRNHYQRSRLKTIQAIRQTLKAMDIRFCAVGAQQSLEFQLDRVQPC
ncbi:DUF58 domain-containing protein [Gallaecimonas xiamenensis]|uniref:DUF58 domain-containing protein n=1 Tax=Gallaecimonas xiamenensis 3-C-1 TaxID=745411 RepID=K2KFW3_9GAMM|nr:DUF58 domain-containing protein [Gallaecimonas xiamenensis]EKE76220.1 hypothetical protein B3C1_04910 [Gallaecimonas xiamenensis 3-C-1]